MDVFIIIASLVGLVIGGHYFVAGAAALGRHFGMSQVLVGGGASRQVTVWVDPDRCVALGVTTTQVQDALTRSVKRLRFLGGLEDEAGRTPIVLDGRPRGVVSIGEIRVVPERPVLVRHVAEVEIGAGREEVLFRVNGQPAVGLVVFQEELP